MIQAINLVFLFFLKKIDTTQQIVDILNKISYFIILDSRLCLGEIFQYNCNLIKLQYEEKSHIY